MIRTQLTREHRGGLRLAVLLTALATVALLTESASAADLQIGSGVAGGSGGGSISSGSMSSNMTAGSMSMSLSSGGGNSSNLSADAGGAAPSTDRGSTSSDRGSQTEVGNLASGDSAPSKAPVSAPDRAATPAPNVAEQDTNSPVREPRPVADAGVALPTKASSVDGPGGVSLSGSATSTVDKAASTVDKAASTVDKAASTVENATSAVDKAASTVDKATSAVDKAVGPVTSAGTPPSSGASGGPVELLVGATTQDLAGGQVASRLDNVLAALQGGSGTGSPLTSDLPQIGSIAKAIDTLNPTSTMDQLTRTDRVAALVLNDPPGTPPVQGPPALPLATPVGGSAGLGAAGQGLGLNALGLQQTAQPGRPAAPGGGGTRASRAGGSSYLGAEAFAGATDGFRMNPGGPTPPATTGGGIQGAGVTAARDRWPLSSRASEGRRGTGPALPTFERTTRRGVVAAPPSGLLDVYGTPSTTPSHPRAPGTPPTGLAGTVLGGSSGTVTFTLFGALVVLLTLWLAGASSRLRIAPAVRRPMLFVSLLERPG